MPMHRIAQFAHLASGLRDFLAKRLTLEQAKDEIKKRMDHREKNFMSIARKLIYENHSSPYRRLLQWAGCGYQDIEDSVKAKGLERTLEILRDNGVYITLEEFKSKVPISRKGLTIETRPTDFENPFLMGGALQGSTSGSRSKSLPVKRNWNFITEEAANEMILYEIHGMARAPLALWLPALPRMAGMHNLLMNVMTRRPPERWFSHFKTKLFRTPLIDRLAFEYILWCCHRFGVAVPRPEFTDIQSADTVAEWMEKTRKNKGPCVVRTYTSSAVRLVQAAVEHGIDISGNVILTGGEPLTEARCRFIESAGVKVFSRYSASETGLIGASCSHRESPDDMHVYVDRLAAIQRNRKTAIGEAEVNTFLFTSLSPHLGRVLLNA